MKMFAPSIRSFSFIDRLPSMNFFHVFTLLLIFASLASSSTITFWDSENPPPHHVTLRLLEYELRRHGARMTLEDFCRGNNLNPCYHFSPSFVLHWQPIDYAIAIGTARRNNWFSVEEVLREVSILEHSLREAYFAPLIACTTCLHLDLFS